MDYNIGTFQCEPTRTYIHQLCVDTGYSLEDLSRAIDNDKRDSRNFLKSKVNRIGFSLKLNPVRPLRYGNSHPPPPPPPSLSVCKCAIREKWGGESKEEKEIEIMQLSSLCVLFFPPKFDEPAFTTQSLDFSVRKYRCISQNSSHGGPEIKPLKRTKASLVR